MGISAEDIRKKVKGFILENFLFEEDEKALDDNASFLENGIIDSTGVIELVSFMEEEFGISINDEELIPENLDSIINLTSFISRKLDGKDT